MYINHDIIFVDKSKKSKDSFFCPVCQFVLNSGKDFDIFQKYDCCHECFLTFAESRKEEWNAGWRPNKTKVKEYIILRHKILSTKKGS